MSLDSRFRGNDDENALLLKVILAVAIAIEVTRVAQRLDLADKLAAVATAQDRHQLGEMHRAGLERLLHGLESRRALDLRRFRHARRDGGRAWIVPRAIEADLVADRLSGGGIHRHEGHVLHDID